MPYEDLYITIWVYLLRQFNLLMLVVDVCATMLCRVVCSLVVAVQQILPVSCCFAFSMT